MSRFFRGRASDSESSDEESVTSSGSSTSMDSSEHSDNEEAQQQPAKSQFSKFLRDDAEDDAADESQKVVKSHREKFEDELRGQMRSIMAAKEDNDWPQMLAVYEKMLKMVTKQQNTIIRDYGYPAFYVKLMVQMEEWHLSQAEGRERMTATQQKAMVALKAKVKRSNAGMLKDAIQQWRNGDLQDFDAEAHVDGQDDEDSDLQEESESDSESISGFASKWKKTTGDAVKTPAKSEKKVRIAVEKNLESTEDESEDGGYTTVNGQKMPSAGKKVEISTETLYVRLREVLDVRGKKNADRTEQVVVLERLLGVCITPVQKIKVLMALISARFEFNQGATQQYQQVEAWRKTEQEANQLLQLLETYRQMSVEESGEEWSEENADATAVRGSLVSIATRLDEEFIKSLQNIDHHSPEYIDRLKDETLLYKYLKRTEQYCLSRDETMNLVYTRILLVEHLYCKYNNIALAMDGHVENDGNKMVSVDQLMHKLCVFLYKHSPDRVRTKALLCHVYHHALNKRFYEARDLLLMSRLQDSIQNTDISTFILYNRTMAQLGICAFRCGLMKESHNALNDIMASLKTKDLLAQGTQISRYAAEADKRDKQRVLPFHMHINIELLECIQLTVSALLEVPLLVVNEYDPRKKSASRHFRRLFEQSDAQVLNGPSENFRETIMQAARQLIDGNWRVSRDLLMSLSAWSVLPDSDKMKVVFADRIKESALRAYLLNAGQTYQSLHFDVLADQFEWSTSKLSQLISRMIISDEIQASIDKVANILIFDVDTKATRLNYLVLQYAEKLQILTESTEKLAELKFEPHRLMEDAKNAARKAGASKRNVE